MWIPNDEHNEIRIILGILISVHPSVLFPSVLLGDREGVDVPDILSHQKIDGIKDEHDYHI